MRPRRPLPVDPAARARVLAEQSTPNETRPRLSDPDLEARMTAAEAERAIRYANREDLADRIERVTKMVDDSEDGAVTIEFGEEVSTVHHAVDLAQVAAAQISHKGG